MGLPTQDLKEPVIFIFTITKGFIQLLGILHLLRRWLNWKKWLEMCLSWLDHYKDKKRKLCKRRAAIEPIIGHLKSDFRLSRNLLKGQVGDEINVLMAACAWNLRKWLVIATIFLFWQKLGLFFVKHLRFFVVLDKKQFCWFGWLEKWGGFGLVWNEFLRGD